MKNTQVLVNIPGFWGEHNLTRVMVDLQVKYPYIFKDDVIINTTYDCFPCIWSGGRSTLKDYTITRDEVEQKIIPFLKNGVGIRYNFTNMCLEEKHLYEKNCNYLMDITMDILKDFPNLPLGITIYSDLLKDYLEKKYPNKLYYAWSTTLGKIGIDEINKRTKKDLLVLDYNYNNDFDFLKQLQNPQNIEILINEYCIPNCPYRNIHWHLVSETQLLDKNCNIPTGCLNKVMKTAYGSSFHEKVVSIEQIKKDYIPLNINKIKLAGRREEENSLARQYADILIKKEYKDDVYEYIRSNYIK